MRMKEFIPRGREDWVGIGNNIYLCYYYTFNVKLDFMGMHFSQGKVNHTGVCAMGRRESYDI